MTNKLRVFLVDDEPLAIRRLTRLLEETGKVEITGHSTEPLKALQMIPALALDAIFLDIQMPELTGFELLQKLGTYPPVIFTTAYDQFALRAFEVFSVDYLLKPIEAERLEKSVEKLEKIISGKQIDTTNLQKLLASLANETPAAAATITPVSRPLDKLPSRIGGKVLILNVPEISCFYAEDKVTFARHVEGKQYPIDHSLTEVEQKLRARDFLRVHRNAIINLNYIEEVHGWFSGKVLVRLKDRPKTEIPVARDRVKILKDVLGM